MDQYLEHPLEIGIQSVIRIGGRSQLEMLKGKNLAAKSKMKVKTIAEGALLNDILQKRDELEKAISRQLYNLQMQLINPLTTLRAHIQENISSHPFSVLSF